MGLILSLSLSLSLSVWACLHAWQPDKHLKLVIRLGFDKTLKLWQVYSVEAAVIDQVFFFFFPPQANQEEESSISLEQQSKRGRAGEDKEDVDLRSRRQMRGVGERRVQD